MLRALSMIIKIHVPLVDVPPMDNQYDPFRSLVCVSILGLAVHMVHSTIPSVSASLTPLGYTSMASSLISTTTQISVISADTTSSIILVSIGGSSAPPPPPPPNPISNTILHNMGQLQF